MPPTSALISDESLIGTDDRPRTPRHEDVVLGARTGDGADDPVTGPMPAVSLAEGRVRVSMQKDVTIVALDGGLDDATAPELAEVTAAQTANADVAILDLEQVTLLDQSALRRVIAAFTQGSSIERCIVAPRLSGRLVLERWGVTSLLAVFTSVADALQARAFQHSGYGDGWSPRGTASR